MLRMNSEVSSLSPIRTLSPVATGTEKQSIQNVPKFLKILAFKYTECL